MTTMISVSSDAQSDVQVNSEFSHPADQPTKGSISEWLGILWLILGLPLVAHVGQSWYHSMAGKPLGDNVVPVVSLVIVSVAVRHYLTTTPNFRTCFETGGLVLFCLMSLVNCASNYLHLFRIYWLSFAAMAFGFLWAIAGKRFAWHWLPIFLFSIELMPGSPMALVSSCSAWLQIASVKISKTLAGLFIPLVVENNAFRFADGVIEVVPACSGLSMLTALIFIVLLWQLINPMKLRTVVGLMIASPVVAMIANGVRLAVMLIVAHHYSIPCAVSIHTNLEFVLLPVAMLSLWGLKRVLPA